MNQRFLSFVLLVLVVGCGKKFDPYDKAYTKPLSYKIDQVKYIARDISDVRDSRSVNMATYPIHESGRLLLRFSGFRASAGTILTQQAILLRLNMPKEDIAFARTKLQVCPITSNWMTFATWEKAHVLNGGAWKQAGGDLDPSGCISPMNPDDSIFKTNGTSNSPTGQEESSFCNGDQMSVCFNLGAWFQGYVQQRGTDFGFIVINDSAQVIRVSGDGSSKYPAVFWRIPY